MGVRTPDPPCLPKHVPAKNAPGFIFPHPDTPKSHPILGANLRRRTFSGRMQYALTQVRTKFGGFHIPAHGCAKNTPDFTLSNKDTPKSRPVLHPNHRRKTFRGVCNTPLHGYVQNLAGFIPPYTDKPKTHPVLDPNHRRKTFRGVCFCALHVYVQNLVGFIFPHPNTPKTHLISPSPIGMHPKPAWF